MFKNKNENILYKCTIRLLDDADIIECEFQAFHRGSYLVDQICEQLKIKEKDYFGLRYVDASKQRHWLDSGKSILKQFRDVESVLFSFRVKFYPADPFRLTGNGRIMLYQQLKRDLRHGRIYCSIGEAAALGSLIVQEELGDYNGKVHVENYVSCLNFALRQTEILEKKIIELHKKREPYQEVRETMDEFVGIVCGLESYGIDPHPVKDHRGSQLYIGINFSGISTFICGRRSQHFRWNEIQKLNFEGKMFIAHLSYTDASREPKKHTIGFKCSSNIACRYIWRCALEQMLFFTLWGTNTAFLTWSIWCLITQQGPDGSLKFLIQMLCNYDKTLGLMRLTQPDIHTINQQDQEYMAYNFSCSTELIIMKLFSLPNSQNAAVVSGGGFFSWGTKFKYTGRTEREILTESINALREQKLCNSSASKRKASSVPATPSSPQGDIEHIKYCSLPRSAMSEPMGNFNTATMESLNNMLMFPCQEYVEHDITVPQLRSLEPLSEEAMLCASSKYCKENGFDYNLKNSNYCTRPRDTVVYSTPAAPITSHDNASCKTHKNILNSHYDLQSDKNKSSNLILTDNAVHQKYSNSAKVLREFRLIKAFIPSFVFVILVMTVAAIFVLESESNLFAKVRNLPEMISLKYQYYQPLKDYILSKLV